jgi:hypothetical protein
MGLIVTFPHLDFFISYIVTLVSLVKSSLLSAFAQIIVIVYSRVLCHTLLFIWYPTVSHDITHFVVVDPLRQPLASKSDRHPVGTLHFTSDACHQPVT